jgi:hypothetical protein
MMSLPGFHAASSLYTTIRRYRSAWAGPSVTVNRAILSGSCVCTSPNCQWTCPTGPFCRRGRNCFGDCVIGCEGDPFCEANCRCCCFGIPCPSSDSRVRCNCFFQ